MVASIADIRFGRLAAYVSTRDLQTACAFYRDVLGFTKSLETGDPARFMILLKDDAELHLSQVEGHTPSTASIAGLRVDKVEALHNLLAAAGARTIPSPADQDDGLRAFVFADPDGNRIAVGQRMRGAAPAPLRFAKRDLTGVAFTDCRLADAVFDDVDLRRAGFSNVNLSGARLTDINLSGVAIDDANIDGLTIFGIDIQALIRAELSRRRGD